MNIDSSLISASVHALEAYRQEHDIEYELRQGDVPEVVSEVARQEQAIRALLPDDWDIEYEAPFYQINLFRD